MPETTSYDTEEPSSRRNLHVAGLLATEVGTASPVVMVIHGDQINVQQAWAEPPPLSSNTDTSVSTQDRYSCKCFIIFAHYLLKEVLLHL